MLNLWYNKSGIFHCWPNMPLTLVTNLQPVDTLGKMWLIGVNDTGGQFTASQVDISGEPCTVDIFMNCQLKIQNGTNKIIRGPRATVLSQPSSFRPHWLQQQEASHGDKGLIIPTCNEAIIKMFNLGPQDQGDPNGPKWRVYITQDGKRIMLQKRFLNRTIV